MSYPTLLWFAGYSNVSSVVIVIICFILMAIFITLVSMNADLSRTTQPLLGAEQRNMVKVVNPFFLQLEKQEKLLKDGLSFHLSRLCPCNAVVLWGVKINSFHDFILKKGHEIRKNLLSEDLSDIALLDPLHKENFQFSNLGDDDMFIPCPAGVNSSTLGTIPRQRYPVAVFVFVPEAPERICPNDEGDSECSNNIVGLISVIHLKDEIVTQSSHVIQQYIKTAGVPIYSLKPLFVNSPSEGHSPEEGNKSQDDEEGNNTGVQNKSCYDGGNQSQTGACDTGDSKVSDGDTCSSSTVPPMGNSSVINESSPSDSAEEEFSNIGLRRRRQPLSTLESENGFQSNDVNDSFVSENSGRENQASPESARPAECVVCQTKKVVCVLLPCRHACVCFRCFQLLDRCPMCRGSIESYFLLSQEAGDESESNNEGGNEDNEVIHNMEQQAVNASFAEMWERLNMRLNAFLGFR
ncbi:hypothetical protein EGW08_016259 [Elysia chlorotica]|uniref:RING-type domain-containing protein n=1 Tax=Elysia chlorotica TaxID=188477 RepID=A0A433T338_ELYCH|nr:hypothetical protein EGW08_016259 [Elysia chlorotica]